jgi:two-component system response regulator HydG
MSVETDAGNSNLFSRSSDPNLASDNHRTPARQSENEAEVILIEGGSKTFATHPNPYLRLIRLLIVDESDQVRKICREAAEDFGFVAMEAETINAARPILNRKDAAILMVDLTRPEGDERSVVAEMKRLYPNTLLIGMSASATIASAVETMRAGACDYLSKPFPLHVLAKTFERAANRLCFDVECRRLQRVTDGLLGGDALCKSVEMEELYRMLSTVAGSRHPVTIVGEPGTGKNHVAKSIHSNGPDGSKQFVSVDCSLMSSALLESKLFGGAKDGSVGESTRGLLATPEGGTIFLDEIDSLNLDLQSRLVKALQERKIPSADGTRAHDLSVRILAATSHDLSKMVRDGRFRMDLYRLLSLVNLKIPPLRNRPGDIVLLAERFLEKIGSRTGIFRTIPQDTLRVLETYNWPDNTRELESAIGQAFILSSGTELEIAHLPQNVLAFCRTKDASPASAVISPGKPKSHDLRNGVVPMVTMEKRAILRALRRTNGDKILAAKLLGIGKTTLYRKVKEYNIQFPPKSGDSFAPTSDLPSAINSSEIKSGPSLQSDRSVVPSPYVQSIKAG